mgnify:CR=1 FL=1
MSETTENNDGITDGNGNNMSHIPNVNSSESVKKTQSGVKEIPFLEKLQDELIKNEKFLNQLLTNYTFSLREYMRESHNNIGTDDDREDSEFAEIFLADMQNLIYKELWVFRIMSVNEGG